MPTRNVHLCLSVRGALLNWRLLEYRNLIRDDSGRMLSPAEAKMAPMDGLAKGREVVPFGPACEGFDYKLGCPGHDVDEGRSSRAAINQEDSRCASETS